jgi:integrase
MGIRETLLEQAHLLNTLPFEAACKKWLEDRGTDIQPKTRHEYELYIRTLTRSFGNLRMPEMTSDLLHQYQKKREADGVSPGYINQECNLVCQVRSFMKSPIVGYTPRPMPYKEVGHALTDDEQERLERIARENQNWLAAYLYLKIAVNTSCGPKEVFGLQLKDLNLESELPRIQVNGTKNKGRIRPIPLEPDALDAVLEALDRAQKLGSVAPSHYLFPFRQKDGSHDPSRPMTTIKTAWRKLRQAAKLPHLRAYDMRHTFVTRALENGDISEKTIEDMVGHIRPETKKKYSHFRLDAQRRALEAMRMRRLKKFGKAKPFALPNEGKRETLMSEEAVHFIQGLLEAVKKKA